MHLYSTCLACDNQLEVNRPGQQFHDACQTSKPTGDPLVDAYLAAIDTGDDATANQLADAIDAEDTRPRPLLPAALTYAQWGWPVFPLQPGSKVPYPGSRGFKDASTDTDLVRRWWMRAPNSNIGLATGNVFDVIDVDWLTKDTEQRSGAHLSWPQLRDSDRMPDVHGVATTPRGGVHAFVPPAGGGNLAGFLPGLDYRGLGGYVVGAPSRDQDGLRYTWVHRPSTALIHANVAQVANSA